MNEILLKTLLAVAMLYSLEKIFHITVQRIKGYKWWYRNVYLRTPHWRFVRRVKLFLAGHKCQHCNERRRLDIHHKSYEHIWLEELFPWELEVLCRYHHSMKHNG